MMLDNIENGIYLPPFQLCHELLLTGISVGGIWSEYDIN